MKSKLNGCVWSHIVLRFILIDSEVNQIHKSNLSLSPTFHNHNLLRRTKKVPRF